MDDSGGVHKVIEYHVGLILLLGLVVLRVVDPLAAFVDDVDDDEDGD